MHFTKLIFAAVGISFAVASPVPQNNNDTLESCNGLCKSEYDTCDNNAATEGIGGVAEQPSCSVILIACQTQCNLEYAEGNAGARA